MEQKQSRIHLLLLRVVWVNKRWYMSDIKRKGMCTSYKEEETWGRDNNDAWASFLFSIPHCRSASGCSLQSLLAVVPQHFQSELLLLGYHSI